MAMQEQDQTQNREPREIDEADLPDRNPRDEDDNEPAIEVRKDGARTEVDVHQKSRKELREEQRREERRRELEEHMAPMRQQLEETRRLLSEIRQSAQQPQRQQPQQQGGDQDEYGKLSEEMEGIIADIRAQNAAGTLTDSRAKSLKGKYYALERQRFELVTRSQLAQYRPPQGPSAHEQMLANSHPEVWFNEDARAHAASLAQVETNRRRVATGRPPTPAEIVEIQHNALKQAGEDFRLTQPRLPAPSNGERARFSGTGATSRGVGGKITRSLQEHEVEAARLMFPNDSDNVAIEKYIRIASKDPSYFGA